jgi:hypothetical protein
MLALLSQLGTVALGEIVKKMVTGGLKWAANRKEPEPDIVELKLGKLADKSLPDTIPADQRQAVVTSLVDLVMPTFEQIAQYDPKTHYLLDKVGRSQPPVRHAAKKAVAKKAPAKKAASRIYVHKESAAKVHVHKKAVPVKHAIKKSTAKKAPAKKAPAKRAGRR